MLSVCICIYIYIYMSVLITYIWLGVFTMLIVQVDETTVDKLTWYISFYKIEDTLALSEAHYVISGLGQTHLASDMRHSRHTEMCKTNKKKRPLQRKDGDSCPETVCKSNDALFLDLTQRNLLSYSLGSSHFSLSLWTTERNNVSPMHRANRFV